MHMVATWSAWARYAQAPAQHHGSIYMQLSGPQTGCWFETPPSSQSEHHFLSCCGHVCTLQTAQLAVQSLFHDYSTIVSHCMARPKDDKSQF